MEPHRVHIQRVGDSYPGGHDPLRFDQDRAVGSFSGLAELTAGTGVTVNAVLPGGTASEGVTELLARFAKEQNKTIETLEKQFFEKLRPTNLLKRFASPGEVANMVVYVCSAAASATNRSALRVDARTVRSIV